MFLASNLVGWLHGLWVLGQQYGRLVKIKRWHDNDKTRVNKTMVRLCTSSRQIPSNSLFCLPGTFLPETSALRLAWVLLVCLISCLCVCFNNFRFLVQASNCWSLPRLLAVPLKMGQPCTEFSLFSKTLLYFLFFTLLFFTLSLRRKTWSTASQTKCDREGERRKQLASYAKITFEGGKRSGENVRNNGFLTRADKWWNSLWFCVCWWTQYNMQGLPCGLK